MIDTLLRDLRYASRSFRRHRGFAAAAVATLALGIGANTAIFSVLDGVLLEPLPYDEPDRIVRLLEYRADEGLDPAQSPTSIPNIRDWRERVAAFEAVAAYDEWRPTLLGAGEPARLDAASVSASFFDVLGVQPILGRTFLAEEDAPGSAQSVVLSHGLWERRFGADPAVIGQAIDLNGTPYTVVGVMPPEFEDPRLSGASFGDPELWRVSPGSFGASSRDGRSFTAIARLRPGVSLDVAREELSAVHARLVDAYPEENAGGAAALVPLKELIVGRARLALFVFLGAVGFVLLIACANVANLLLARAATRSREIAVRSALGASRRRLLGQLLTESIVLALAGGALGVLLAFWTTDLLLALGASELPRTAHIGIDGTVLAFAVGISCVTGLLFGLVPALQASRPDLQESLKEGGRGTTTGRRRARFRRGLITAEVALSLVLLAGAGLLVRSFHALDNVDPGVRPEGVLTLNADLPGSRYGDRADIDALYTRLLPRVRALPGVRDAGVGNIIPLSGRFNGFGFTRADAPPASGQTPSAETRSITPGYLRALSIPVVRGRGVLERDRADSPPVVVINRALAERYWPDGDPVGSRVTVVGESREVVGIVGDVHQFALDRDPEPVIYLPNPQAPAWLRRDVKLVLRTAGDPLALAPAVRSAVWDVDDRLPIADVRTMQQVVDATTTQPRFRALLLTLFAAIALVLGALGIYGVVSYTVAQRQHELGVRITLGASPRELVTMVVRQGMRPVLLGLAIGLAGALVLGRALSSLLYGVGAADPATLGIVVAVLAGAAVAASYIPARRATRVDPVTVIRNE